MSKKFSAALKIVSEVTCAGTRETPSAEDCVLQFAGQNSDDCSVLQQFLGVPLLVPGWPSCKQITDFYSVFDSYVCVNLKTNK